MSDILIPTLFDFHLSDTINQEKCITKTQAITLFLFFKDCPLFNWRDVHNNCEARAEAICRILDAWQVPNYKAWVFSGAFLKHHIGGLKQHWNYHVATLLPVDEDGTMVYYVIDPATAETPQILYEWAANVTEYPHSYHCIKLSSYYIFSNGIVDQHNWNTRNSQNKKWMLQGLAGINGLTTSGKAQLCFRKQKIKATDKRFQQLMASRPSFD